MDEKMKVVKGGKEEVIKEITKEDLQADIELFTQKGTELQKYIATERCKNESFALRRLRMEQFNAYCSLIECFSLFSTFCLILKSFQTEEQIFRLRFL